ncbi:unnamed protein product [Paramecium primaurelia]|uniref:WD40-repeat-containing domain n=1 Tax=Paramecium primaurelia TaxID=5886 RepID=A0A8S1Q963_PARPR|nr:unnamed protein product [Paramecium primaurelia]
MIYKPDLLQQQKQIDKTIKQVIYEGINYQVYENKSGHLIKQYKFENIYDLNELIKTLELEQYLSKQTDILYAPQYYHIEENNTIYIQYQLFYNLLRQVIQQNQSETQKQKEDQDLYNDLIDDNEKIYEVNPLDYAKELQLKTQNLNVTQNLINTIIKLYELELNGFMIKNIKPSNIIYNNENLQFMDNFLQSIKFEVSLEEYLILDFIKQQYQSNNQSLKNLGRCYMQLYLLIEIEDQQENEYLELINKYYGSKIYNLLRLMIQSDYRYFTSIMQSQEFLDLITPLNILDNKQLFIQFFEKKQQKKEEIWERIKRNFEIDQQQQIWQKYQKSNLQFMIKEKEIAKYRVEYKISHIHTHKLEFDITDMVLINQQINQNYERAILLTTIQGKIIVHSNTTILNIFQCSLKSLRSAIKFKLEKNIYVAIAGDDKIVYVYNQNEFQNSNPKLFFQITNDTTKQIYSLLSYDKFIIFGDEVGSIYIYKNWTFSTKLNAHSKRCNKLYYSNNQLLSVSHDQTIKIWDSFNFIIKHIITGHTSNILNLFIFDNYIYSFSDDKMIRFIQFNPTTQKYDFVYQTKFDSAIQSCIQYNEQIMIFGNKAGQLLIYNIKDRIILHTHKIHLNSILAIYWTSHSQGQFITIGQDKIFRINAIQN